MKIDCRPALPADAGLMRDLTLAAWRGTVADDSTAHGETVEYIRALLVRGGGLIITVDGEPAGSVRWFPVPHERPSWEIKRLGVIPRWRGHDLGRLMMARIDEQARVAGIERLQLGIRRDRPTLARFYESLGYLPDDEVRLSATNPLTPAPITLSKRLSAPQS
ncbi:MAG: GNAT family N-acetyltransferase [Burkholderiaceae bacterium]